MEIESSAQLRRLLAGKSGDRQVAILVDLVKSRVSAALGGLRSRVDESRPFRDLGLKRDAREELRRELSRVTGVELPPTAFFDHPNTVTLARHLRAGVMGASEPDQSAARAATAGLDEPVAVVGMACRYGGGVWSPEDLWELVAGGRDAVTGFPADRGWDLAGLYDPDPERAGKTYTRHGAFLSDIARFDAPFFGVAPREALAMDPQQRLLLETTWEAFERAGIDPRSLGERTTTGAFIGTNYQDYRAAFGEIPATSEGYVITGNAASVMSGRLAYVLGLLGPVVTVDTACSSSLVALHQACRSLRVGECDLAVAGGASVLCSPEAFVEFSRKGVLSPDGRCKAFAESADGTGWGEGVGIVLVERLSDAVRQGRKILAVIRGSAVNHNGASNGLTAPHGPSQERVIRAALGDAGVSASEVDVVEAHGTGTRLGDPIEVGALLATYGRGRPVGRPLWLGSVKSNIAHTQAASGVAGLIKMVKALEHGVLPKTLHVDSPTSHVDWSSGAVRLLTEDRPWPDGEHPRRAAISSFGVSGTNGHLILEQAPEPAREPSRAARGRSFPVIPWVLSGRSEQALQDQAARLLARVEQEPEQDLLALGAALVKTRTAFEHRAVIIGSSRAELRSGLGALAAGEPAPHLVRGVAGDIGTDPVFVFPGQGSHWVGMGRSLWGTSPVFAEWMDKCAAALGPLVDWDLATVLDDDEALTRVDVVQPVLWSVMVSLAQAWRAFGVEPAAVLGHSQGEIAAACVAGAVSLEDCARVVVARSRALTPLAGEGGMIAVMAPPDRVHEAIAARDDRLAIAAVNGPASVSVVGDDAALAELERELSARHVMRWRVPGVDFSAHSRQIDRLTEQLAGELASTRATTALVPFFSTVDVRWLTGPELDGAYWYRNLRQTVRFGEAVTALAEQGHRAFVEMSPQAVLTTAVEQNLDAVDDRALLTSALHRDGGDLSDLYRGLAEAYVAGMPVDWSPPFAAIDHRAIELPTYAFQGQRYWPEKPAREESALDELRYRITWMPAEFGARGLSGTWLAVLPDGDVGLEWADTVLDGLADNGAVVLPMSMTAGVRREELLAQLRSTLADAGLRPSDVAGVVSLLALAADADPEHPGVPTGLAGVLGLIQALGDAEVEAPLWIVTSEAVSVDAADPVSRPSQAMTWGLGRVVGLEHPNRWGGLVDLPATVNDDLLGRLTGVLAAPRDEDHIAIRPAGVFVRRLIRARLGERSDAGTWVPRRDGTVLITGGTGVQAGHVARWLASAGAGHLVLLGRRGEAAPGMRERVAELEALGAKVTVVACDVRDKEALRAVLASIPEDLPLSMVVHAAGIGRLQSLADTTVADLAEIVEAKASGARHLHELTENLDLDAFVLFSAITATWGVGRHGSYGAANTFLEAIAQHRRGRGLPATAIAWGGWAGDGMAIRDAADETLRRRGTSVDACQQDGSTLQEAADETLHRWGVHLMPPELLIRALRAALDVDETLVTVADVDWERFVAGFTLARRRPLLDELPEAGQAVAAVETGTGSGGAAAGRSTALRDRLAETSRDEGYRIVLGAVRAQLAEVLAHGSPGEIDQDQPFSAMGVDSVTAVQLRNGLGSATGQRLPATVVFDHPTVADLATFVHGLLVGAEPTAGEKALAAIDVLEEELSGDSCGPGERRDVAARLSKLVRTMSPADEDPARDLESAGMSEVLDILDSELDVP